MKVRRAKPYVCVDCDFADHFRFQEAANLETAAGTWLRCLAYSRAQEQDGVVKATWLHRTFVDRFHQVDELVKVGLLLRRPDGDYEIHAYAPRNQTKAMLNEARETTRERVATYRARAGRSERPTDPSVTPPVTRYKRVTNAVVTDRTSDAVRLGGGVEPSSEREGVSSRLTENESSRSSSSFASSLTDSSSSADPTEFSREPEEMNPSLHAPPEEGGPDVTLYKRVTSTACNAFVPTSTSTSLNSTSTSSSYSSSPSLVLDQDNDPEIHSSHKGGVQRGEEVGESAPPVDNVGRPRLPLSERALSGPAWLEAFSEGVSSQTGRPCSVGRMYFSTLERIISVHAPERDAASACRFLRDEARAFARKWDGKHPPKGLTPDGLERWLNEGRVGPPEFGPKRILQLPPEEWHEDDFSDLGAEVVK